MKKNASGSTVVPTVKAKRRRVLLVCLVAASVGCGSETTSRASDAGTNPDASSVADSGQGGGMNADSGSDGGSDVGGGTSGGGSGGSVVAADGSIDPVDEPDAALPQGSEGPDAALNEPDGSLSAADAGGGSDEPVADAQRGPFTELSLSSSPIVCGLTRDADVECWGVGVPAESFPEEPSGELLVPGPFTHIATVDNMACGIEPSGAVRCWQTSGTFPVGDGLVQLPGEFTQLGLRGRVPCGVRADASLFCNSASYSGSPIEGSFVQLATGQSTNCGLADSGELSCFTWLSPANGVELANAPSGQFLQVDSGDEHACAVASDRSVVCWGDDNEGETAPPEGEFLQVSAGYRHSCGVRVDGSLACWGLNDDGQSDPPAGVFSQVAASVRASCALTANGYAVCWGLAQLEALNQPAEL